MTGRIEAGAPRFLGGEFGPMPRMAGRWVGVVAHLGLRSSLGPYVVGSRGQAWLVPPTDAVLASVWVGPFDT